MQTFQRSGKSIPAKRGGESSKKTERKRSKQTLHGEEVVVNEVKDGGGIAALAIKNTVGQFSLKAGKYKLRVTNMKGHRQLKYVPAKIFMWYSRA